QQVSDSANQVGDTSLPSTLLAVDGDLVFLTGGFGLYCIDWTRPVNELMVWHSPFSTPIRGRGFVTADSVYACTASGPERKPPVPVALHPIARPSGKVVQVYPP